MASQKMYTSVHNSQNVEITQNIPSWMNGQIKYDISIHIDYFSSIKRNKVLIHAVVWMNLENMVLNERSQSQKTIYCMI